MPGSIGAMGGGASGLSPSAPPEVLVRDEISSYAATAIVDDIAILRLHTSSAQPAQGGDSASRQQGNRMSVHRVKSGQAMMLSGITVRPQVHATHVEFTIPGSSVVVASVALESTTAKYTPEAKEQMDQGFANRIAPSRSQNTLGGQQGGAPSTTPTANGAAGSNLR